MAEPSINGRYPLKQAEIDAAGIATPTIVSGVAGKSIRVISIMFTVAGPTELEWRSNTTPITGSMKFADAGGLTHNGENGIFWTAEGEDLILSISAAVSVDGVLTYVEVD